MLILRGQVCGVQERRSQKGTDYLMVKILEMGDFAKITYVQDFRGVSVTPGEQVEMKVSVRPYLNKAGSPQIGYTAWNEEKEAVKDLPIKAVGGGKYK